MSKVDIYQVVTDRIIDELEKGNIPWQKPWTGVRSGAISHSTGKAYSLINQLVLGEPGEYITFNQCKNEGGKVKKGSKAKFVVFWKMLSSTATDKDGKPLVDADGKEKQKIVPYLQYYQVFHINDCEGITPKYKTEDQKTIDPIQEAEKMISSYASRSGVSIVSDEQDRAFYRPSTDTISIPIMDQFLSSEEYYSTLFHEATHSTGHESRLNRLSNDARFGNEVYSKEELVAEIGAATLMNELDIETSATFKNSAAYIQSWLRALKNDKRMVVSAAGAAEKAVKMIMGI